MEKVLDNEHLMECIKGYLVIYHRDKRFLKSYKKKKMHGKVRWVSMLSTI